MILNYSDLYSLKEINKNNKIGLFKGTFDLMHHDHIKLINEIKKNCDLLVVEVKSDEDVRAKKGKSRPIINQFERAYMVDNLKSVDYTIIADKKEQTAFISSLISEKEYNQKDIDKILRDGYLIEKLNPDMIFTSTEKPVPQIIIDLCNKLNVEIKVLPMQNGLHTTDIIEKCKKM